MYTRNTLIISLFRDVGIEIISFKKLYNPIEKFLANNRFGKRYISQGFK